MSIEAKFLLRFLPSFSRIGYLFRERLWAEGPRDFSGQTWLITGASDGLGRAAAQAAAAGGATVIAVARSADKLAALAAGSRRIIPLQHDLASTAAMATLVRDCQQRAPALDVLVNNVGALYQEHARTVEGFEASYALNLLGQFVLTEQLLAGRGLAPGAAVIAVTSGGLYTSAGSLAALSQDVHGFDGVAAYAAHKRAQLMLTDHWNASRRRDGPAFYAVHPGWVDTPGLARGLPAFYRMLKPLLRTPAQGVDTLLWLAGERPAPVIDQVWFDRAARPSRVGFTPRDDRPGRDALVEMLQQDAARHGGMPRRP